MKSTKFLAALAAIALTAFSCGKDGDEGTTFDPAETVINWYRLVNAQNNCAMDPFNVAFRLNLYLNKIKTEIPEKHYEIKNRLLGELTEIDIENGVYTLKYLQQGTIEGDSHRRGWLVINTYGDDLNEVGTVWTVTTNNNLPYAVSTGYGWIVQGIRGGSYTIETVGVKQWNIEASAINTTLAELESTPSAWSLDLIITQTTGEANYDALLSEEYGFTMNSPLNSECGGLSLAEGFRFKYKILSPVLYSSKCGSDFLKKAGGKERIEMLDETGFVAESFAEFDMGREVNCMPTTQIWASIEGEVIHDVVYSN